MDGFGRSGFKYFGVRRCKVAKPETRNKSHRLNGRSGRVSGKNPGVSGGGERWPKFLASVLLIKIYR
jgi:hypothetical protein